MSVCNYCIYRVLGEKYFVWDFFQYLKQKVKYYWKNGRTGTLRVSQKSIMSSYKLTVNIFCKTYLVQS